MSNFLILLLSLVFIVISSHFFCNALEHLGERLGVSEGVTGSVFAAVGTALPETIIPIIAILSAHSGASNHEIGIGAILGAPLMLSTLSVCVMALSVLWKRGINGAITPEKTGLKRDLQFFFFGYGLAFAAIFLQNLSWHVYINALIAVALGVSYFIYLLLTIKVSAALVQDGHDTQASNKLAMQYLGFGVNKLSIIIQLILASMMLIYFAGMFIDGVNNLSTLYKISPFIISLIIIPIATELPEKINSVLWLRKGKDTLAVGNITGAMVFQGTLLPIIGILFTDWRLVNTLHLSGIILTLLATGWFYLLINKIKVWHFLINGLLYIVNIMLCLHFFYR
ncbi:MAG: cation:H+ antiporter [Pseudomonadota bacterium]|nr:cation:H+ antiporter [Pseudomonadota bacterium]